MPNLLTISINNYNNCYFYFLDSKPNHVIDGIFTKIIYTHPSFTMNGLYFQLPLTCPNMSYDRNKNIVNYDSNFFKTTISKFRHLEQSILSSYKLNTNIQKKSELTLSNQLQFGKLRVYDDTNSSSTISGFVLKISGIWENKDSCGITYRVILLS